MLGLECDRSFQRRRPMLAGVPRIAEHEVEAESAKAMRPRQCECLRGATFVMHAAEQGKVLGDE